MIKQLGEGIYMDMGAWPRVGIHVDGIEGLCGEAREQTMRETVDALGKLILGTSRRELRFRLVVELKICVTEVFAQVAPFIVEFALAMGKPELLSASATCMEGTDVLFHSREDEAMVEVIEQLIAHIPQGAPVTMAMAQDRST
jgi:hypothetical protein